MAAFKQSDWQRRVFGAILLLAICASLGAIWLRDREEKANRTVGVVMDYTSIKELAQMTGQPLPSVLSELRRAGVWGVALDEITVEQAAHEGLLLLLDGKEAGPALQLMGFGVLAINPTSKYVAWWPQNSPVWLVNALRMHIEPDAHQIFYLDGLLLWEVKADLPDSAQAGQSVTASNLVRVGLGLSEDDVRIIRQAELTVVPRFLHTPTITAEQAQWRLAQINSASFTGVPIVFSGERIAGYPDLASEWTKGLRAQNRPFAQIEFSNSPGSAQLAGALSPNVLRLHTITIGEMAKIEPQVAVARWVRAVRERNIRLLYVRPLPPENPTFTVATVDGLNMLSAATLWQQNLAYVEDITQTLQDAGYTLGMPVPLRPLAFPWWLWPLLAAAAVVGAWWLCLGYVALPPWLGYLIVGVGVLGFTGLYVKGYTVLARQAYALLAAIVYPTLGVLQVTKHGVPDRNDILKSYLVATGYSLIGALLVIGLLADARFMQMVAQFAGVKLAHIVPPALIFLAVLLAPLPLTFFKGDNNVITRIKQVWRLRVPAPYLALAGVIGLAGVVYLLRTGNQGLNVPSWEQRIRELLETWLVARPRTKEFLVGHPLLVTALDQLHKGRQKLAGWLMIGASIGQLSLVNTFSHIHTPLWISALRTGLGLLFGLALGWLVFRPVMEWVARLWSAQQDKTQVKDNR
jgi:hypothetical protein